MNGKRLLFLAMVGLAALAALMAAGCGKPAPPRPPVLVKDTGNGTADATGGEKSAEAVAGSAEKESPPGYVRLTLREKEDMLARLSLARQKLGSWQELRPALARSLAYLRNKPDQAIAFGADSLTCTWKDLQETVAELIRLLPELDEHPAYLKDRFDWYRLAPPTLMTGYYEPLIHASPVPCPEYPFPLYGIPKDLKIADLGSFHPRWNGQKLVYRITDGRIKPYHSREAIDSDRALEDQGVELAWVRDLVDIFFLQIQGSGRLVFPDGSVRHVLYAGKNGHRYVSLGRVLIQKGYMSPEQMSMQGIRTFLKNRPGMVEDLLNTNPSYVFFRLADDGPYGAMGATLTPLVSVASDPARVPLGSVLLQQVRLPGMRQDPAGMVLLGLAQDRGGAINGDHVDLFCGAGEMAAFLAGHMQERADVCILISSGKLAHQ
ncbi:murein transglycosylase A [Desulfoplanes sp.]